MRKVYSAEAVKRITEALKEKYFLRLEELRRENGRLRAENGFLKQRLEERVVYQDPEQAFRECGELDMEKILRPDEDFSLEELCKGLGLMDE